MVCFAKMIPGIPGLPCLRPFFGPRQRPPWRARWVLLLLAAAPVPTAVATAVATVVATAVAAAGLVAAERRAARAERAVVTNERGGRGSGTCVGIGLTTRAANRAAARGGEEEAERDGAHVSGVCSPRAPQ